LFESRVLSRRAMDSALMVLRAATTGLGKQPRISHCDLATARAAPIQIEGVMQADTITSGH
jgi:hypothetical protein